MKTHIHLRLVPHAAGIILLASLYASSLTAGPLTAARLALAAALLGLLAALAAWSPGACPAFDRRLSLSIGLPAAALWVFSAFRFFGLILWPLACPKTLADYAALTYSHAVLAGLALAGVLWARALSRPAAPDTGIDTFHIGRLQGAAGNTALAACAIAALLAGVGYALLHPLPGTRGPLATGCLFAALAVFKACLTALTEESIHRGVILPAAVERYGACLGILVQSLVFTGFHLSLYPSLFPRAGFIAVVWGLGLLFGWISYLTRGIGWAVAVHAAVAFVVEWDNLC